MDLLTELLRELDSRQYGLAHLESYWNGRQELSYLSPEAKAALAGRFQSLSVNIPRLQINVLSERIRLKGMDGIPVYDTFLANDLDQRAGSIHRMALLYGESYAVVYNSPLGPQVSIESPRQMVALEDPGTRKLTAAVKRYYTKESTEVYVYLPDRVEHWSAPQTGAAAPALKLVDTMKHDLGALPVVRFQNSDLLGDSRSEILDTLNLTDCLCKLNIDLMTASEFGARQRRWASGVELIKVPRLDDNGEPVLEDGEPVEDVVSPFAETDRMLVAENDAAKFGSLPGSDLAGYQNAVSVILSELSAVTGLTPVMLGIRTDMPASAEAIAQMENGLTSKAEHKIAVFGRGWEEVAQLIWRISNTGEPPKGRAVFGDPAQRSLAAEADAAVKLVQAGIWPKRIALQKMGFDESAIDSILADRDSEIGAEFQSKFPQFFGGR